MELLSQKKGSNFTMKMLNVSSKYVCAN